LLPAVSSGEPFLEPEQESESEGSLPESRAPTSQARAGGRNLSTSFLGLTPLRPDGPSESWSADDVSQWCARMESHCDSNLLTIVIDVIARMVSTGVAGSADIARKLEAEEVDGAALREFESIEQVRGSARMCLNCWQNT
jgi:hypothetical protein